MNVTAYPASGYIAGANSDRTCCYFDRGRSEAVMPSGRFMAEKSTRAWDAPDDILQACLDVTNALGQQESLQSGASRNIEQTAGIGLGLNQRRSVVNSALRNLQRAHARTPLEFGMKALCFRQVKDSLGEDDTRVGELALALLDEAVALFSRPSSEGLPGSLEKGDDVSSRNGWRPGLFTRPHLGGLLGWNRRSQAGE
jgi:hypothetical protein